MRIHLTILILFFTFSTWSQSGEGFKDYLNGYIDYRLPVNDNRINSSNHGINVELSLSVSKFFSKNDWVSIFGGWGCKDRLWLTEFNSKFAQDYDVHSNTAGFNGIEASGLSRLQADFHSLKQREIPLPSYHSGFHEMNLYYGLIITPPNPKLPVLKIYTGYTKTVGGVDRVCTEGGEFAFHRIKRPLTFGVNLCQRDVLRLLGLADEGFISISLYYELSNFSQATYQYYDGCDQTRKIPFSEMVDDEFLAKYKNDIRFGFKVGVWLRNME